MFKFNKIIDKSKIIGKRLFVFSNVVLWENRIY